MDKRPLSPNGTQALVKRQRIDDQQAIIGSITKDVSRQHKTSTRLGVPVDLLLPLLMRLMEHCKHREHISTAQPHFG